MRRGRLRPKGQTPRRLRRPTPRGAMWSFTSRLTAALRPLTFAGIILSGRDREDERAEGTDFGADEGPRGATGCFDSAEELSSRARARKEETLRTSIRERQAARADRDEESEELARLPYDHANAVNIVAKYCPDYPPRLLKRYLPGLPVSLDRLSAERTVVERLLGWKLSAPDPCMLTNPVILSAPRTLLPG